jgi:serine/threonine protein kinase
LAVANDRFGFVHRDIHQGQILFDKDRQPVLIDFGRSETTGFPFVKGRYQKTHYQDVMDILRLYNVKIGDPFPTTVKDIIERMEGSKYICFSCGKPSETICGGCALFSYCSKDCQAEHFDNHQEVCRIASIDANIVRQGGYWVKLLRAKGVENLENSVRRRELSLDQLRDLEKVLSGRNGRKYRTLKRMVAEEIGRLSKY